MPCFLAGNEGHEGDEGKPDRLFHFFWTMYDQHPTLVADALSSDTVRTRMTRTRTEGVEETASEKRRRRAFEAMKAMK